jgi:hypothetical protein
MCAFLGGGQRKLEIEILLAVFEAKRSPDSAADVEGGGAALGSAILGSAARGATIAAFLFPRPLVYLTSMPEKKIIRTLASPHSLPLTLLPVLVCLQVVLREFQKKTKKTLLMFEM